MEKVKAFFNVLKAGEELTHAATWKRRQNAMNALLTLLGSISLLLPMLGLELEVSREDAAYIAGGIAAIGGMLNTYLTTATSKKVGLQNRFGDNTTAGRDDSADS